MKVVTLSRAGIQPARASLAIGQRGAYWVLTHGQEGRGRWQWRCPLGARDFMPPMDAAPNAALSLEELEISLKPLGRKDARGNELFLGVRAPEPDGRFLVLWHLSPGYRGGATYEVAGDVEVIGHGEEAQGEAGRMGGALCPVVVVGPGPATLRWTRTGRLYDTPAKWIAVWDGERWTVSPEDECEIEEAALNW